MLLYFCIPDAGASRQPLQISYVHACLADTLPPCQPHNHYLSKYCLRELCHPYARLLTFTINTKLGNNKITRSSVMKYFQNDIFMEKVLGSPKDNICTVPGTVTAKFFFHVYSEIAGFRDLLRSSGMPVLF
jgi:hypothetical protein